MSERRFRVSTMVTIPDGAVLEPWNDDSVVHIFNAAMEKIGNRGLMAVDIDETVTVETDRGTQDTTVRMF